ncbi:MAG: GTP-binding protein [Dehalococcoidia bacterium]|nr:GTP-binding protein [Dehalococcoidia bacterium]HCV00287.1 GTP-binding protein [Dehalococcoidia bacterium]|tara:strand:+ start:629 stop:850 length:222 start_codon:yes stop_codon:yes gene_type:complete
MPEETATLSYSCTKCSNPAFKEEEIRATGKYGRFFDMQSKKFTAVICENCGYTDFYRMQSGRAGNVLDFLSGG